MTVPEAAPSSPRRTSSPYPPQSDCTRSMRCTDLSLFELHVELARLSQRHLVLELSLHDARGDDPLARVAAGRRSERDAPARQERRREMRRAALHLAARGDELADRHVRAPR